MEILFAFFRLSWAHKPARSLGNLLRACVWAFDVADGLHGRYGRNLPSKHKLQHLFKSARIDPLWRKQQVKG